MNIFLRLEFCRSFVSSLVTFKVIVILRTLRDVYGLLCMYMSMYMNV